MENLIEFINANISSIDEELKDINTVWMSGAVKERILKGEKRAYENILNKINENELENE